MSKKAQDDGIYDFNFDRVYGPDSRQVDVFNYSAKPIIQSVLEGFNATLFCYGQTCSGKTFTMEGPSPDDNELKGIIPRTMEYIFENLSQNELFIECSVKCSFLEIYNEKIQDLLDPRKNNLTVKEDKEKGIWVQDSTELYISSKEEMLDIFRIGTTNRSIGSTKMNEKSSRSHSIFIITIFQRNTKTESTKSGKLYLVDLAGSEKLQKTEATGQGLEEAKNINKSLMTLGIVIKTLSEGKNSFAPFRDSKLTRILQESLGGNALTMLIITGSMSEYNDAETLSTLRFGQRAKNIKNKPVVNSEKSAKELLLKSIFLEEKIQNYEKLVIELQLKIENLTKLGLNSKNFNIETNDLTLISKSNLNNYNNYNVSPFQLKDSPELNKTEKIIKTAENTTVNVTKCMDCTKAMGKLLNLLNELAEVQEEADIFKNEKEELEREVLVRNQELYEANERSLLLELLVNQLKEQNVNVNENHNFKLRELQELISNLEKSLKDKDNEFEDYLLKQTNITSELRNKISYLNNEIIILQKKDKLEKKEYRVNYQEKETQLNGMELFESENLYKEQTREQDIKKLMEENNKYREIIEKNNEQIKSLTKRISELDQQDMSETNSSKKSYEFTPTSSTSREFKNYKYLPLCEILKDLNDIEEKTNNKLSTNLENMSCTNKKNIMENIFSTPINMNKAQINPYNSNSNTGVKIIKFVIKENKENSCSKDFLFGKFEDTSITQKDQIEREIKDVNSKLVFPLNSDGKIPLNRISTKFVKRKDMTEETKMIYKNERDIDLNILGSLRSFQTERKKESFSGLFNKYIST